jgi:hypothetical protein
VTLRPPSSRYQLTWNQFARKEDGRWILVLPPYYAGLFTARFPSLMAKSATGFRNSSTGKTKYAFFQGLDDPAVRKIEAFLEFFARAVCLSTNKHLGDRFADELDFCLALDFNRPSPTEGRTEIGEWEYQAKYHQAEAALAELANGLAQAIHWLPRSWIPKPRLLTCVPSDPGKEFYLPAGLAEAVIANVPASFWGVPDPRITARLKDAKHSAKNLTVDQKMAQWEQILQAKGVQLSRSVRDCSVIVVDDLYQSGASLWSFAEYLKGRQAGTVVGLACVKSLRDTDNQ